MNTLLALILYGAAAILSIITVMWALADLGNIPDRCPRKTRVRRERPVFMRTGLLLTASAFMVSVAVNPLM